jgi:hypothetical protein
MKARAFYWRISSCFKIIHPMPKITKSLYAPLYAVAAFLILATTSCKKTDVPAPAAPAAENTDELRDFIMKSTGETNVTYNSTSKNFIIDNDALMSLQEAKDHLKAFQASGETLGAASTENIQHRKSYYSVARTKAVAVNVYADASVPAVWVTALDQSITNWNNANCLIHITRVTNKSQAQTVVYGTNNGGTGVIATTYYPDYNSNPGKSCTINTYYNYLSNGYQVFALTHELGHAFGFGHTNSTYGTLVSGTPDSDGYSVMNSVCKNWSAFSTYDLLAFRTVYPK